MTARAEPRAGALPPLRFLTLGPLEVHRDGVPLELGPPQQRALLAALLVDAPHSVPMVTLLERLWGSDAPSTATKSVQKYVSNLRRILGVDRVVSLGGYGLVAGPHEIDATAFDAALDEARGAATPSAALAVLDAAIDSWRGEPYADLVAADFLEPVRRRAAELRATIGEERLDALLALGAHDRVIAETAELLREHPFRERLWRQRATGLAAAGRQAEALEVLRELRGSLAEHLGIDPSPATQDLELVAHVVRALRDPRLSGRPQLRRLLDRIREPRRCTRRDRPRGTRLTIGPGVSFPAAVDFRPHRSSRR